MALRGNLWADSGWIGGAVRRESGSALNGTDIRISHCGNTPYVRYLGRAASRVAEHHVPDRPNHGGCRERRESPREVDREQCAVQVLHKQTLRLMSVPFGSALKRLNSGAGIMRVRRSQ